MSEGAGSPASGWSAMNALPFHQTRAQVKDLLQQHLSIFAPPSREVAMSRHGDATSQYLLGRRPMKRWDHFIDGQAVPPKSARYLDDHDPATREKIAEVARGDAADVDAAVAAARVAFAGWRDRRPIERGRILLEIARKIREKSRELSELERLETGKPPVQVPFEIEVAAQYFELYGGLVSAPHGA